MAADAPQRQFRTVRYLGDIPAAWGDEPIADLFDIQLGKMLSKKARQGLNLRPYLGNSNVQWGHFDLREVNEMDFDEAEFEKFELVPGDLLICEGGEVGRTAIWNGQVPGCCYQKALHRLRSKNGKMLQTFLAHYMFHAARSNLFVRYTNESSIAHLSRETLMKVRVPVPPKRQQQEIAEVLDAVDEAIEATRAVIDQTRQLKTALLQDLLTNGLPGRHKKLKRINYLGQMPLDWSTPPIGDVCEIQLGKMLSKAVKTGRHSKPYLGNSNIKWGAFDLSNLQEMDIREDEMERYSVRKGDILICEGGEVGRTAVWQGAIPVCCYQKAIHRLRAKPSETLVPMFMRYFMEFAVRNNLLTRFTGESSIAHLTRETLVAVPMPLPPHEEQLEIVRALTAIEAAENSNDDSLRCLTALKSALSQGLLTGRIPVRGVA